MTQMVCYRDGDESGHGHGNEKLRATPCGGVVYDVSRIRAFPVDSAMQQRSSRLLVGAAGRATLRPVSTARSPVAGSWGHIFLARFVKQHAEPYRQWKLPALPPIIRPSLLIANTERNVAALYPVLRQRCSSTFSTHQDKVERDEATPCLYALGQSKKAWSNSFSGCRRAALGVNHTKGDTEWRAVTVRRGKVLPSRVFPASPPGVRARPRRAGGGRHKTIVVASAVRDPGTVGQIRPSPSTSRRRGPPNASPRESTRGRGAAVTGASPDPKGLQSNGRCQRLAHQVGPRRR